MSSDITTDVSVVVLTAPSGAGKTTIARGVIERLPNIRFSVSATTRERRGHEQDGVDYHFVSEKEFQRLVDSEALLEYEEVYAGRFYGTLWSEVENSTPGNPVLLDIDVLGAGRVKERFGDQALVIFIEPPSLDVLRERLEGRRTEDTESLNLRISRAKMEISMADRFDHSVLNDDVSTAVNETVVHIESFLAEREEAVKTAAD